MCSTIDGAWSFGSPASARKYLATFRRASSGHGK
jgi:hypothetical protein